MIVEDELNRLRAMITRRDEDLFRTWNAVQELKTDATLLEINLRKMIEREKPGHGMFCEEGDLP